MAIYYAELCLDIFGYDVVEILSIASLFAKCLADERIKPLPIS